MLIGVSGASGKLGQAILLELKSRGAGDRVIGITRSLQAVEGTAQARLGDYDRPDTLLRAYTGLDRLLLIPSADLRAGVRSAQLKAAIDAAVQAGVAHIFLISASGTREVPDSALNAGFWNGEQHLISTAPKWTILRMNYYAESMAEEVMMSLDQGVLTGLGDEHVAYVSRDDLAAAAAGALLGEGHAGAVYNITGPAIVTGPEKAAIASNAFGKALQYAVISPDQLRAGFTQTGFPAEVVEAVIEIKRTFVEGNFDILTNDVERLSGRVPKSLHHVLVSSKP
ncbi:MULTISPECIES: NAD(P)H-binding protein [Burkholderia]|uniref:NAD(P)H-binding protein n=1 Tax=Burkholderia TaxID=32008 RepID=UPI00064EB97D|nr:MULTISPECIES: NAD(P)H-binding protein [Burkholderia]KML07897.1 nucleoside-diphosphate sugar epimerase [Burkholderia cepacia]KMN62506.1 nucleoside-diphosphate sugar epimerase [Burkholderia sp. LK4]